MRVCTSCRRLLKENASLCAADGAASEIVETLPKNTRLGIYRIVRLLGEGGMGFVYEAIHDMLHRHSAIKMLRPEFAENEQVVTRFLNEARAVNLIDHQNIVNIYDYSDGLDGGVYFVMELLEGEPLDVLMNRRGPLPVPLLLHVFGQIAKALGAAHAKKIVHRDLKPGNVFIISREDNPCFVKLLDFGIAQLRGEAAQALTLTGTIMGTPQYMSPEQISGDAVDARSDVWALGVMLYLASSGHSPFGGGEFAQIADRVLHYTPPPPGAIVPLPASLSALIVRCLQRRIEDRCQSVGELITGLDRVKQELRLDDRAILAAVKAELCVATMPVPQYGLGIGNIANSPPQQRNPQAVHPFVGPRLVPRSGTRVLSRGSRLGLYLTLGSIATGLASGGYVLSTTGDEPKSASAAISERTKPSSSEQPIGDEFVAGDRAKIRARAEQHLRATLASQDRHAQNFAVDALALARVPAGAKLLHDALKGSPGVRVKAARALGDLALPDSVPKVRAALAEAGDKLKVELAAVLYRLGDKDARAILKRATEDPGVRLTAAAALAEAGDDAGRAALADLLEATPPGREQWRRAASGLMKLGDARARKLLEGELVQLDATRSVGAAELLARAGDSRALEQLARNLADPEFARPGDAAVALSRLGDKRALGWVLHGLTSSDPDERRLALAVCGSLATDAATHIGVIAKLAIDDPDLGVRMTAEAVLLEL